MHGGASRPAWSNVFHPQTLRQTGLILLHHTLNTSLIPARHDGEKLFFAHPVLPLPPTPLSLLLFAATPHILSSSYQLDTVASDSTSTGRMQTCKYSLLTGLNIHMSCPPMSALRHQRLSGDTANIRSIVQKRSEWFQIRCTPNNVLLSILHESFARLTPDNPSTDGSSLLLVGLHPTQPSFTCSQHRFSLLP